MVLSSTHSAPTTRYTYVALKLSFHGALGKSKSLVLFLFYLAVAIV